ncbi:STAS domain-containing protein [Leptospira wolffii]|uniref:STAS domain-containing protein n=1 Tax=Leptospira wolffii TaxID=409998 RepID=A0A2M9ZDI8_9LEPT|nr:STAS domain-containing protein [Leptospira wolffii]EPG67894.1 STAS domain protein [Leptospira wolffii serovar Khorat str. Khorat-H2]PJZ66422.1 STAS domain-containing protein [Leptospira wolffii]TGK60012.1 STAS domain-containing protein [Leptospira wolffii]TGK72356.1 STAS domain-containing protein [Leptospira wolffii]TGK76019.1 STAS domain-containing protein [Leptospira wolffii]
MAKLTIQNKQGIVRFENQLIDGYEKVFDEISEQASKAHIQNLTLDLTPTKKITSSGVAKLLTLRNLLDHFGVKLEVINLQPNLLDVLRKFKVDAMLRIRT